MSRRRPIFHVILLLVFFLAYAMLVVNADTSTALLRGTSILFGRAKTALRVVVQLSQNLTNADEYSPLQIDAAAIGIQDPSLKYTLEVHEVRSCVRSFVRSGTSY